MASKAANGTWIARITIRGKLHHIGTFDLKSDAEGAENTARKELGHLQAKRGRQHRSDWRKNIDAIKTKLS